jgi:hypothetical protein
MLREPAPPQVAASLDPVAVAPSPVAPVAVGVATERAGPAPAPVAKPIMAAPVAEREKKSVPLKNLGALGNLFQR